MPVPRTGKESGLSKETALTGGGAVERCRKKDILRLVKTMMEANDSVIKALPAAPEELTDVFVQCQDAALQIGTYLETLGEQYGSMVAILEDYCEKVYQMSIATSDANVCRKLAKKIRRQLSELQSRIQCEMPEDRKEVVFLPYKASMWDSLESVWRAADADPNCDAYVVPIPYFDKNPDGSFREMHYEGDQYPEDVPITHYEEYDFRQRRPDMIFIHNPYDEGNRVTSVHPSFYSKNLKQYTEQLVYIPYFVLEEIDPENEAAIESIKHFIGVSGVYHADRVIVQSGNMKKIYVEVLTALNGKATRGIWEKKILDLGSPKMDKIHRMGKENLTIPKDWMKVMRKEDGSFKKIILYNTSVTALLQYNERMLEKLKDVFRVFHENRQEVVLLWRPHPLIPATVSSMRPRLLAQYQAIVEKYRKAGWGIYDDTADLERAIAISDGYYGDHSSLVAMYQETGRPIMIQVIPEEKEGMDKQGKNLEKEEWAWCKKEEGGGAEVFPETYEWKGSDGVFLEKKEESFYKRNGMCEEEFAKESIGEIIWNKLCH